VLAKQAPPNNAQLWAEAAITDELANIRNLDPNIKITKPGNDFYISLLKIASILKGDGRRHLRPSEIRTAVIDAAPGAFRYKGKSLDEAITYQFGRAMAQAEPRYRSEGIKGEPVLPNGLASRASAERNSDDSALLGNTTDFAYNSRETENARLTKWQAQRIGQKMLPGFRIQNCMSQQVNKKTEVHCNHEGQAFYKGLMTCGSAWVCPVCGSKIAAQRREEIREAVSRAKEKGFYIYSATFTLQHTKADKLDKLVKDLGKARAGALNGRWRAEFREKFGYVGYIYVLEVRGAGAHGWHPHRHELLIMRNKTNAEEIEQFFAERYGKLLEKKGYYTNRHTVVVTEVNDPDKDYLTKSAIELEITGGQWKRGESLGPFQMLAAYSETGDLDYSDLFREYAVATAGKSWVRFSPGLRDELGMGEGLSDEEVAAQEEAEEETLKAVLNEDEWAIVVKYELRGELLVAAKLDVISQWLIDKGIRSRPEP